MSKRFIFAEHNIPLPSIWPHYRTIAANLPPDQITTRKIGSVDHEIPAGSVAIFAESPTPIAIPRPFKLVHVFHGLAEKGYTYEVCRNRAFDLILSPGPRATSILIANGIDPAKIAEVGMPKLDGVFNRPAHVRGSRPVVLYAPTGIGDWRSSLRRIRPEHLINSDAYELRFRVHPLDKRGYEKLAAEWAEAGAMIDRNFDPVKIFDGVDLLISDYSSIAIEFALTGRPVLKLGFTEWLDNPNLINDFEFTSTFTRSVDVGTGGRNLFRDVTEMLSGASNPPEFDAALETIIPRHLRDGRAGQRAAAAIMKLIEAGS